MDENKEEIKALDENQTDGVAGGKVTPLEEAWIRDFIKNHPSITLWDYLKLWMKPAPKEVPPMMFYGVPDKRPHRPIRPRFDPKTTKEP